MHWHGDAYCAPSQRPFCSPYVGCAAGADVAAAVEAAADHGAGNFERPGWRFKWACMNEVTTDARPLTSVELLDAAVWREIGSEEPQPQAAFLEALSAIVGRWLLVRSNVPTPRI